MKILLALLPYWTPQIPPMGISVLKSFLQRHGYAVRAIDLNTDERFEHFDTRYFDYLMSCIPAEKRGNFRNIGGDVLRTHMMAHLNRTNDDSYAGLVKEIVYQTFFTTLSDEQAGELDNILKDFYHLLEETVTHLLQKEKPEVFGLSVFSGTLPASLFAFKLAKKIAPHIMTVMGGGIFADQLKPGSPECDYFLENTPYIDKIVSGEGEILFLKLLQGRLPAGQRLYGLEDIDNETLDLSMADIPDFSGFDLDLYPAVSAYSSRSCPYRCAFCSETVQWGKYRKKKAPQIAGELRQLYRQHNTQLFFMVDSLLDPVINELAGELAGSNPVFYWDGYLRVSDAAADMENTLHWRRAGFYRARLGVESGSPQVLKRMGKRISPARIKAAVRSLAYAGIKTTTYWVAGYPGEREEDFQRTLDLITELKDDIYEAECNPFNYFLSGQVNSGSWEKNEKLPLFPGARDRLLVQTWVLDHEPHREEIYRRVGRFVKHCAASGIPNPYTLYDIDRADKRWQKLHKNAVPSLVEFKNKERHIDECRHVQSVTIAGKNIDKDLNFRF